MRYVWLGIALCVLTGCSQNYAPVVNGWNQPAGKQSSYVVQKGDTLYSLAWAFNIDFRDLAAANRLTFPYRLKTGQKLMMISGPTVSLRPIETPTWKTRIVSVRNVTQATPLTKTRAVSTVSNRPIRYWLWPSQGKIVQGYSPALGEKGIDIGGKLGEPVRAAAPGEVVYCGSGLVGYGNLIIIKHNDSYLSAYAHNENLLVKEGQSVKAGQEIAQMGMTPIGQVRLHFEIRRNGLPVNPITYLKQA